MTWNDEWSEELMEHTIEKQISSIPPEMRRLIEVDVILFGKGYAILESDGSWRKLDPTRVAFDIREEGRTYTNVPRYSGEDLEELRAKVKDGVE